MVFLVAENCEKSWSSLKLKYTRERKKGKKPTGSQADDTNKWTWFEDLSFLNEFINERRRTTSNCGGSSSKSTTIFDTKEVTVSDEESIIIIQQDDNFSKDEENDNNENSRSESPLQEAQGNDGSIQNVLFSPEATRKRTSSRKESKSIIDDAILETCQALKRKPEEESCFGELVARELSAITDVTKRKAKKFKIMEILYSDD